MGVRNTCGCTVIYEEERKTIIYSGKEVETCNIKIQNKKTLYNDDKSHFIPTTAARTSPGVAWRGSAANLHLWNSKSKQGKGGGGLRRRFLPGTSRQVTVQKVANKVRALAGHASPSPPVGRSTLVRPHVRPCLLGSLLLLLLSAYFFPFCFDQGRRCGTVVLGRSPIG